MCCIENSREALSQTSQVDTLIQRYWKRQKCCKCSAKILWDASWAVFSQIEFIVFSIETDSKHDDDKAIKQSYYTSEQKLA